MNKITFGFSQLKEETPKFIHWISITGATLITVLAGLQALYPTIITDHVVSETAKIVAAIRIVGQLFGVKQDTTNEQGA